MPRLLLRSSTTCCHRPARACSALPASSGRDPVTVRGTVSRHPASATLGPRERRRRAVTGGAPRSAPWPLLVPALVAIAFLVVPLLGLLAVVLLVLLELLEAARVFALQEAALVDVKTMVLCATGQSDTEMFESTMSVHVVCGPQHPTSRYNMAVDSG